MKTDPQTVMIVICIPAYNEEKSIGRVISEIKEVMSSNYENSPNTHSSRKYKYKILVLNDGSVDRTAEISKKNGALVVSNNRNLGLAETFKREMDTCLKLNPDIIVHTDADGQYPAKYIPFLVKKIEKGYDLVLGSRFSKITYSGSFMRKLGNIAFAKVFSHLLRRRITDTTTGFRAFTKEVAELPLINSFTYTQEQLIRAGKAKMSIAEIQITTNKTRESRLFGNSIDYAFKAWINILRIYRDFEPIKFFGIIGIVFIILGSLLGIYIVYNILSIGNSGGIPRVMLSMLLILVGVQIGLFGFLADMWRK